MPIYDYKCNKCNSNFSLMRRRENRDAPALCPTCGTETKKRVFTVAGLLRSRTGEEARVNCQGTGSGIGWHVQGGTGNIFRNCEANYNGKAGFVFEGPGRNTLINTKCIGNPTGLVVRNGAQIDDHNTVIE